MSCIYKFRNGKICGGKIKNTSLKLCTKHDYQMKRKKDKPKKETKKIQSIPQQPIVKPKPLKKEIKNMARLLIEQEIDGVTVEIPQNEIVKETEEIDLLEIDEPIKNIDTDPIITVEKEESSESIGEMEDLTYDPKMFQLDKAHIISLLEELDRRMQYPGNKEQNEAILRTLAQAGVLNREQHEKLLSCIN
jgi:hypothetical protein